MVFNVAALKTLMVIHSKDALLHHNAVIHIVNVMSQAFFVQMTVKQPATVLAGKYVIEANVEQNVILVVAQQVNYVKVELVLQDVEQILIVATTDHVLINSVLILVNAINHVVKMLFAKLLIIVLYAYVKKDSKVNQQRNVPNSNVKPMMIVRRKIDVLMVFV